MATTDKNSRPGTPRGHNGHSNHTAHAHSTRAGAKHVYRIDRELPRRIQTQLKSNPAAVIAAVGAGSFVLGALLGSRLGRLAIAAAVPYLLERVFEGVFGEGIADYVQTLREESGSGGDAAS